MSNVETVSNAKPRKPGPTRPRLTPLQRLVAAELMVHRKVPPYLIASAFGVSSHTVRKLAREFEEQVA